MPWWGWVVVGVVLLGGEMLVDSEFYLVFIGVAAVTTGLLGFFGLSGPIALQWAIFGGLSVGSLIFFRRNIYARLRGPDAEGHENLVGEVAITSEEIAAGAHGRAELRGSQWSARNVGDVALPSGARARVEGADGLVLRVRKED